MPTKAAPGRRARYATTGRFRKGTPMKKYTINTNTDDVLIVRGDTFAADTDEVSGELLGYTVTHEGELVARVAAHAFVSVVVSNDG